MGEECSIGLVEVGVPSGTGLRSILGGWRECFGVLVTSLGTEDGVPSGSILRSTLGSKGGYFGVLGTSPGCEDRSMDLVRDGVTSSRSTLGSRGASG